MRRRGATVVRRRTRPIEGQRNAVLWKSRPGRRSLGAGDPRGARADEPRPLPSRRPTRKWAASPRLSPATRRRSRHDPRRRRPVATNLPAAPCCAPWNGQVMVASPRGIDSPNGVALDDEPGGTDYSWADLLDMDLPPERPIIARLIGEASGTIVGGSGGSGKLFMLSKRREPLPPVRRSSSSSRRRNRPW